MDNPVMKMSLGSVAFWCEACDGLHAVLTGLGGWSFNGNLVLPTLTPSITIPSLDPTKPKCEFVIEKGNIRYLRTSGHIFEGDVLKLRPIVDWPVGMQ